MEQELLSLRFLSQLTDTLMSRAKLSARNGITYGGRRDINETCGYAGVISASMYRGRYMRNGIAARVVETKPLDTWRGGFEIIEDAENLDTLTPFEKAWNDMNTRLRLVSKFQSSDILAGIGTYSILLIGAPGEFETPLRKARPEDIKYVQVYGEDDAVIKEYDDNINSPRFGLPVFYEVKRTNPLSRSATNSAVVGKKVHFSRVIHIADGLLDNTVNGTPRLERVWNLLDDLEKITGGGSEAYWIRANQGMHINIDPTLNPNQGELDQMSDDIDDYRHKLQRVLRTRGASINMLGSDTADIKGPADAILDQICASVGIPKRVFTGSEQGKLASEQDSVKYYRQIEGRRLEFAEIQIVRAFIGRMIELGALPAEPAKGYVVDWSLTKTLDDAERATLAKDYATINATDGVEVIGINEIRRVIGFEALDDAEIENRKPSRPTTNPTAPGTVEEGNMPASAGGRAARSRIVNIVRDRRGLITSYTEA